MRPDPFAQRPAPRRLAFLALCLLIAGSLLALLWRALAPGGWTIWEGVILACFLGTLPWSVLSAGNALLGFALLMGSRDPARAVVPQLAAPSGPIRGRTALVLCVRREAMEAVLPLLVPMLDGLPAEPFALWVLSDTPAGPEAEAEEAALRAFAAARAGRGPAVRYRRRAENTGFKAGNIMDFLDHDGAGFDYFLTLDADSAMSAEAVLRLVHCLEADPKLAIVQHLVVGRPVEAAFPRLFQFGMRAGMRAWATGQGWWQLDEGPYWGHNALLRVAPFRAHARLPLLPGGRPILSHDQVEAARLHAAGWKVRCLPLEEGSQEGNPPSLPDYLARDARWGAGNMQYLHLLRLPGLTAMARWQFVQAILLFLNAPFWVLMLAAAVANAASGGGGETPPGALAAVMLASWFCNYASKLMGYLEVLMKPALAARYGGQAAVAGGVLAETAFTLFFEPVSLVNKSLFLALMPFGRRMGWAAQNRAAHAVGWREAGRLLWPHTLLGAGLSALLAAGAPGALPWALPFLVPLLLAIPFCVLSAGPGLGAWLAARGLCAIPEERAARIPHS